MNSLTTAENQQKLSEREIELGTAGTKNSWHNIYRDSAWIFVGGLPFDLTEGDVICIFSQYGEIVNINMVRDKKTGKTKGYAFICYEDQRSTILAVDNFNTAKVLQRTLRVDHVKDYRPPDQNDKNVDDVTQIVRAEGVAPKPLPPSDSDDEGFVLPLDGKEQKKKKKEKKMKKEKKVKKEKSDMDKNIKKEARSPPLESVNWRDRNNKESQPHVKEERSDPSYNKYARAEDGEDRQSKNSADDGQSSWNVARKKHEYPQRQRESGARPLNRYGGNSSYDKRQEHSSISEGKGAECTKRLDRRRRDSPTGYRDSSNRRSRSRERRRYSRSPTDRRYR